MEESTSNFGLSSDGTGVTMGNQNFGDSLKTIELEMEWHVKTTNPGDSERVYTGTEMVSNNPKPSCRKCTGRGYTGYDIKAEKFKLCACVNKTTNFTNRSEKMYRAIKGY
jgi:hypothetical protein